MQEIVTQVMELRSRRAVNQYRDYSRRSHYLAWVGGPFSESKVVAHPIGCNYPEIAGTRVELSGNVGAMEKMQMLVETPLRVERSE